MTNESPRALPPGRPQLAPPVAGAEPEPITVEHVAEPGEPDYTGAEWTADRLREELLRLRAEVFADRAQIDRLAMFIVDRLPEQINPELGSVEAADIAIRVLTGFIDHPNGRLEPVVREAIKMIDAAPAGSDRVALVEVLRAQLLHALTAAPRPGGGPPPIYESDDIVLVRFDRDRFRVELNLAYEKIAEMFAAATGKEGFGPEVGVVEDLAAVRARQLAAEEALANALAHRCDPAADFPPKPGTDAYRALQAVVEDMLVTAAKRSALAVRAGKTVADAIAPAVVPLADAPGTAGTAGQ